MRRLAFLAALALAAPSLAAPPAISSLAVPIASVRVATVGHSITAFLNYSIMGDAVRERIAQCAATSNGVEVAGYAVGGSAMSRTLGQVAWASEGVAEASSWWDDTGAGAAGTALTPALAALNARGTGNAIQGLIDTEGYKDRVAMNGSAASAVPTYRAAKASVFAALRATTGFSATGKIGLTIPGRYLAPTNLLGLDTLRQETLRLLTIDANTYKAAELYDYDIGDAVHPSRAGQRVIGYRIAESICKNVLGATTWTDASASPAVVHTIYDGPSITGISLVDGTHVAVTIGGNGESVAMPVNMPGGFAFAASTVDLKASYSDASPAPIVRPTAWSVSGSTITFTLPSPIATATVQTLFPLNDGLGFDPAGVIRGASSGKPLQSWFRG